MDALDYVLVMAECHEPLPLSADDEVQFIGFGQASDPSTETVEGNFETPKVIMDGDESEGGSRLVSFNNWLILSF